MWKNEEKDDPDWGDDLFNCKVCAEDTSASDKLCSRCRLQEYIDNDESFDPRRFGFEAG